MSLAFRFYVIAMLLWFGVAVALGDRPNVVLIIADDMNWNDCGAYGHKAIRTPNIDQLAAAGMRFDHAYLTVSSCSPSRSSIITGKYPHNTGAEQLHWPLPPNSKTFVDRLTKSGYYTVAAGKWHLGESAKSHFSNVYEASTAGFQLPNGATAESAKSSPQMVAKQPSGCESWIPALRARPKDKPFFMWLAALDPHRAYEPGTLDPPHRLDDVVVPAHLPDTPEVREDLRRYYDEIGRLDQYVGKVLAELKRQEIEQSTIVIFISDNGRPFPRDKTTLYDGGIKTPFIVRWPNHVRPGTVTQSLVSSIDLAPTILQLVGLPPMPECEGVSFVPILNDCDRSVREYIFAEDHWHDYEDQGRAVANQRFKLIRNDYPDLAATPSADAGRSPTWQTMLGLHEAGKLTRLQSACFRHPRPRFELYDLVNDPEESLNLADSPAFAGQLQKMKSALNAWANQTGDYLPSQRTPDEFDRRTGEPDHSVRVRPRRSKKDMYGTYGKY